MNVLDIKDLTVVFKNKKRRTTIVENINFEVAKGECVVVLGESGSGKSMTMKAVTGLLDKSFDITGKATLNGDSLLDANKDKLRSIRGKKMTMILQNPMTSFDSLYRIGYQMSETFKEHTNWSKQEIKTQSIQILDKMQINNPEEVLSKYPHQLSGGMLQRIMIGIALALDPEVLIADEPTTAIDSITQKEIMKEFIKLKNAGVTMVFITHDLGVASLIADRIIVMNNGKIVDIGTFKEILDSSKDPYTKQLVEKKRMVLNAYKKALKGGE